MCQLAVKMSSSNLENLFWVQNPLLSSINIATLKLPEKITPKYFPFKISVGQASTACQQDIEIPRRILHDTPLSDNQRLPEFFIQMQRACLYRSCNTYRHVTYYLKISYNLKKLKPICNNKQSMPGKYSSRGGLLLTATCISTSERIILILNSPKYTQVSPFIQGDHYTQQGSVCSILQAS